MKAFIWEHASGTTSNYHDGAGVVVFAQTLEEAREKAKNEIKFTGSEVYSCEPDHILNLTSKLAEDKRVFIFPDAGCC